MAKLRIMSDLHLEFGQLDLEPIGEDVLVLAGDIGLYTDGARWAVEYARRTGIPAVMIAGNHEFYRRPGKKGYSDHTVRSTLDALRRFSIDTNFSVSFLEDDTVTVAGVTFVGCTLWTDYALYSDPVLGMAVARRMMNDHRLIYVDDQRFDPNHAARINEWSVGILRERLPRRYVEGPLVVMTHHLPSRRSVSPEYEGSPANPAYASNLDDLVAASEAAIWVHGHTHSSHDYMIGNTRVLCNPRGYYTAGGLNRDFDVNLIVEV